MSPRKGPAFSNSTLWERWAARWCDECLRDALYRNGINTTGCPLIVTALGGEVPDEWKEVGVQEYECSLYRRPGTPRPVPRPRPRVKGQLPLFPRPPKLAEVTA